jgi:cytoskeletal protein CcmA (bactofilin family)
MAIWKENTAFKPVQTPAPAAGTPARYDATTGVEVAPSVTATPSSRVDTDTSRKESVIAADITIEGKIEGGGSVRIAGKFKGDVTVQGDLTIEVGAKLTGSVRADKVMIAGELEGNVVQASRVDLLKTAVVSGELKAGSLTVEAGARMRGQAEFGWDDDKGSVAGRYTNGHGVERGAAS